MKEKVYETFEELPEWAKPAIRELIDRNIIQGTAKPADRNLNLNERDVRMLVIVYRMFKTFIQLEEDAPAGVFMLLGDNGTIKNSRLHEEQISMDETRLNNLTDAIDSVSGVVDSLVDKFQFSEGAPDGEFVLKGNGDILKSAGFTVGQLKIFEERLQKLEEKVK